MQTFDEVFKQSGCFRLERTLRDLRAFVSPGPRLLRFFSSRSCRGHACQRVFHLPVMLVVCICFLRALQESPLRTACSTTFLKLQCSDVSWQCLQLGGGLFAGRLFGRACKKGWSSRRKGFADASGRRHGCEACRSRAAGCAGSLLSWRQHEEWLWPR